MILKYLKEEFGSIDLEKQCSKLKLVSRMIFHFHKLAQLKYFRVSSASLRVSVIISVSN